MYTYIYIYIYTYICQLLAVRRGLPCKLDGLLADDALEVHALELAVGCVYWFTLSYQVVIII